MGAWISCSVGRKVREANTDVDVLTLRVCAIAWVQELLTKDRSFVSSFLLVPVFASIAPFIIHLSGVLWAPSVVMLAWLGHQAHMLGGHVTMRVAAPIAVIRTAKPRRKMVHYMSGGCSAFRAHGFRGLS